MRKFTAVIERCADTGLLVGYVPGLPGAHSQGESLEELHENLAEVIGMLLEDGEPKVESEFVGTRVVEVA
jgi:predicted RNase H-like HicB family nuclease